MLLDGIEIDAVVLDAGGVLLMPDPAEMRRVLMPLGIEPDDISCHRGHFAGMAELAVLSDLDRLTAGETPDWIGANRRMARELGVPDDLIEMAAEALEQVYVSSPYVPVEGVASVLRKLESHGCPFAVVSNADGTIEAVLDGHGICSVGGVDVARAVVVVDSAVVGVQKPDPAIFTFALDALGVEPERCVYVGDTVCFDVRGAEAAGLHPVHIDPFGFCSEPGSHRHIDALAELPALLGLD